MTPDVTDQEQPAAEAPQEPAPAAMLQDVHGTQDGRRQRRMSI